MSKKLSIFLVFIFVFAFTADTFAQGIGSTGLAVEVPLSEQDVPDGSIICQTNDGFVMCPDEYHSGLFAIVADDPALSIRDQDLENTRLTVNGGNTLVRVSAQSGAIAAGDFITSSTVAGVGMKADRNGFVIGQALEPFDSANPDDEGLVLVALNIHPTLAITSTQADLLDALRRGLSFSFVSPLASLRFIIALIVIIITFAFGLFYFGRQARAGVEAIARNPMARRTIQVSVFVNVLLGLVVILGGLFLAALIIVF